jgi:hypothetical protein
MVRPQPECRADRGLARSLCCALQHMLDCAPQVLLVEIAHCVADLGFCDLVSLLLGQIFPRQTVPAFIFRDRIVDDRGSCIGSL